jgi:hypothetical protein
MSTLALQPGDIVAVRGSRWLSRLIMTMTGGPVSHVGLVIATDPDLVLEALERVLTRPFAQAIDDCAEAWVCQPYTLSQEERWQIVHTACAQTARTYGYSKLVLQALNVLFHTRFFTRHAVSSLPICSLVVAEAFSAVGKHFGQPHCCATPADIAVFTQAHPEWYRIIKVK